MSIGIEWKYCFCFIADCSLFGTVYRYIVMVMAWGSFSEKTGW